MRGYQQQQKHSALHELDETVTLLIDLLQNQDCDVPLALQNEQHCDVEFDDGLGLRF